MTTPLAMPRKKITPASLPVRLAWTTSTGDRPARPQHILRSCPGCDGEASKAVGARLGCPICPL